MQKFTFDTYKVEDGHPPQDHILWDLPEELAPHRDELIRQAGLPAAQIHEAGELGAAWGKHPTGAVILAPALEFENGQVFAVSREAPPSTP